MVVGTELEAVRFGVDHLEREVAGLELGTGYSAVSTGTGQAQQGAVELRGRLEVPGRHRDEVDAGDERCWQGHRGSARSIESNPSQPTRTLMPPSRWADRGGRALVRS